MKILKFVPGVLLLLVVGLAGKYLSPVLHDLALAHVPVLAPLTEYVLLCIIIGLLIRNIFGLNTFFKSGIETYEFWLKMGIVFLGGRFLLQKIFVLSSVSLVLVVLEIFIAIGLMLLMGRWFKLSKKLTHLLAVGSSICGVSAIIGAQGAIKAKERDLSFAVAAILAIGAFGVFVYPVVGHWLGMSDQSFGLWAGLSIDNTAEVVAGGSIFSETAGNIAVIAKNSRNAMMAFVILGFAIYWAKTDLQEAKDIVKNKWLFVWQKFPKFVLGFLVFSLLSTVGFFSTDNVASLKSLYEWCFMLTFAGVGLQTDFREMRKVGFRPFIVGATAEIVVAVVTLGMVLAADAMFVL